MKAYDNALSLQIRRDWLLTSKPQIDWSAVVTADQHMILDFPDPHHAPGNRVHIGLFVVQVNDTFQTNSVRNPANHKR